MMSFSIVNSGVAMYILTASVLVTLILSVIGTKLLIKIMPKLGVIDTPSKRRAHKKPTPRAGGLSLALMLPILLPFFEYLISGYVVYSIKIIAVTLLISAISFLDDVKQINVVLRFFVYILCSAVAINQMISPATVLHYELNLYFDIAISTIALGAFLNVYNFLDGIDGITCSQTIHLSVTIIILTLLNYDIIDKPNIVLVICSIILGWSIGFIYYNWHPAKIFMGDVGSITIGFLLGLCMLMIASASFKLFAACVIASLYYIADGGLTILIRLSKGEKIWEPHLQHFFQKATASGKSHKRVVKRIVKCNIGLMTFAITSIYYPLISIVCSVLVVVITLIRSVI